MAAPFLLYAQSPTPQTSAISDERILGVIPNFQAVNDPAIPYTPLHVRDKWLLFVKETLDPYTFASSAAGAGMSQWRNGDPKYGDGVKPYFQRFGAAQADVTTQDFFSDAVLASLLREDPRYFREGPSHSLMHRIGYATSRVVITRKDTGRNGFNFSGILGMGLGIVLSNSYYPPRASTVERWGPVQLRVSARRRWGICCLNFGPTSKQKLDRWRHR